jgi:DNA-binding transcriptional ArsR family regulator
LSEGRGAGKRGSSAKPDKAPAAAATAEIAVHPVAAADAALGRVAARLSTLYFLRSAKMISDLAGGDLIEALIMHGIMAGNFGHIDQGPNNTAQFTSLEDVPPDDVRRPISVLAVAGSLGMPYETVRRHVKRLVKAGRCVRVKGGVIAPVARLQRPETDAAILNNMANLRRLYRALKRAGVEFD